MAKQNLAAEAAERFKQSITSEGAAANEQGVDIPAVTVVPPVQPVVAAQVVTPPATTTPPPVEGTDAPLTFTPITPVGPTARELELEQELANARAEAERYRTTSELSVANKAALDAELEQLRLLKQQQEVSELLTMDGVEFNTLAPESVAELKDKLLVPAITRLNTAARERERAITEKLEQERQARQQAEIDKVQAQQKELQRKVDAQILAAHPDLQQLQNTREYVEFMRSPVAGSSFTQGDLLGNEYRLGNAEYVIEALKRFRSGRPDLSAVASVANTTTASHPAEPGVEAPKYTLEDVSTWKFLVQSGKMTRQELSQKMTEYRAQQQ